MSPDRMLPLCLAALLQVMPMVRAVLPAAQAVASPAWAIVLKLAAGAVALLGSYHSVSGATSIVPPHTVNATNGVKYTRQLTVSGRVPGSWSADTAPLRSPVYPIMPGLYLTNVNGKIGGIPTQTGTTNVTITVWEFANNTGGRLSAVFTITVYPSTGPPEIAAQPQSRVVVEGLDAMFNVSARGIEPFAYQWRLNGADLPGRTNSTLLVSNAGAADVGLYSVRITNSLGATNSQNATLTVLFPPAIVSQPSPAMQTVNINDPATLAVTARGTVPMGFRWRRNGMTVTNIVLNTTNSVFTIPSAQLADAGIYTVVVTNTANTNGIVSSDAVVNVIAGPANIPPLLNPILDQLVLVGDTLALTAQATDANTPAQTLTYSLLPGAPPGAAIDPSSGLLIWPTFGVPAPQTNLLGIRVTDNGSPSLSATQIFRAVVTANHAPVLADIPDLTADVLELVRFTNVVADADLPLDTLSFSLGPGAPQGARIHHSTGLFYWSPSRQQAKSTNFITVIATDDGVPPRSDSRTFKVVVNDYAELYSEPREELVGDVTDMPIFVRSSTPVSNLTFNLEFDAHLTNFTVQPGEGTATVTFVESNRVGLRLSRTSPQPASGETLAYLSFTVAADQPSAFVPMRFTEPVVERPDGTLIERVLTTPGRVATIGSTPMIEGFRNVSFALIYGRPGDIHIVETATNLANGGNWSLIGTRTQTELVNAFFLGDYLGPNRPSTVFFRARPWVAPPPAPANLVGTPDDQTVALNWQASSNAVRYILKRAITSGGPYIVLASNLLVTTYTDTAVTNNLTYYYIVTAVNSGGEGAASSEFSATPQLLPPLAPTGLTTTAGNRQVSLAWNAALRAVAYNVKRSINSGGPYTTVASNLAALSFTDSGLSNDVTYFYVVSALNPSGQSPNSDEASAQPMGAPPPIVKLSFDENGGSAATNSGTAGGSLVLTAMRPLWSANLPGSAGGVSSIDFGTATGNFVVESPALIGALAGLSNFTICGWVNCRSTAEGPGGNRIVTWINAGGDGVDLVYHADGSLQLGIDQWSDSSTALSSAGRIPADASASVGNWRFFAVTYEAATTQVKFYFGTTTTDATLDVMRAYAGRGAVGAAIGRLAIGHFNSTTRSTALDRMFRGLIDEVQIFADALSLDDVIAVQHSTIEPPAAPTDLVATGGNGLVNLAWSAAANAARYIVKRSTTSGSGYTAIATNVTSTNYSDTAVANGTTYYYVVAAANIVGESGNSSQANATPMLTPPPAPMGLVASAGNATVGLFWNTAATATGYNVKRATASGGPHSVIASNIADTNFTDTNVVNGTTYFYIVSARNAGGEGPNSTQASATPNALPVPIVKLAFNENADVSTTNSGSAGGSLALTTPTPAWSANTPTATGGLSAVDFGTITGNFAIESPAPIGALAGLSNFTICGWVNCRSATEGPGGNRIVTWINHGGDGVDLVYRSDGSLQLGVDQWPDTSLARSSAGRIPTDAAAGSMNWRFFAVTYTAASGEVKFYFGSNAADATLDVTRSYARGAVGTAIGRLAIGHFNSATRASALNRMFRGLIDQVEIYGTVLSPSQLVSAQHSAEPPL